MKFEPKSEKQIIEENLTPEGEYDFEVVHAEEKQSSKGNEMIELSLKVFVGEKTRLISDYLLEAMAFKLIHFCEATGLSDRYEAGILSAFDCIGSTGKLELVIQPGKGTYGPKNSVKDYIPDGEPRKRELPEAMKGPKFEDDSIPF